MRMLKTTALAILASLTLIVTASAGDWATTTTTHIESSPWGTYKKIEFPKAELPRSGTPSDFNFYYLLNWQSFVYGNYQYVRVEFVRVPLVNAIGLSDHDAANIDKDIVNSPEFPAPRLQHNQIVNKIIEGDQPLFCLWQQDFLLIRKEGSKADVYADGKNVLAEYRVVLDTPPVSIFEGEFWGKDLDEYYGYRWLNTPISTVYSESKTPEEESMCVLKALFVSAYDHNINRNGGVHDSVLNMGLVKGYNHTVDVTLTNDKVVSKREYYGILDTFWDFPCKSGVWISESSEKGNTRRLLSLPFVGPVWASWRNAENGTETHWGVFPILWLWATDIPRPPTFDPRH